MSQPYTRTVWEGDEGSQFEKLEIVYAKSPDDKAHRGEWWPAQVMADTRGLDYVDCKVIRPHGWGSGVERVQRPRLDVLEFQNKLHKQLQPKGNGNWAEKFKRALKQAKQLDKKFNAKKNKALQATNPFTTAASKKKGGASKKKKPSPKRKKKAPEAPVPPGAPDPHPSPDGLLAMQKIRQEDLTLQAGDIIFFKSSIFGDRHERGTIKEVYFGPGREISLDIFETPTSGTLIQRFRMRNGEEVDHMPPTGRVQFMYWTLKPGRKASIKSAHEGAAETLKQGIKEATSEMGAGAKQYLQPWAKKLAEPSGTTTPVGSEDDPELADLLNEKVDGESDAQSDRKKKKKRREAADSGDTDLDDLLNEEIEEEPKPARRKKKKPPPSPESSPEPSPESSPSPSPAFSKPEDSPPRVSSPPRPPSGFAMDESSAQDDDDDDEIDASLADILSKDVSDASPKPLRKRKKRARLSDSSSDDDLTSRLSFSLRPKAGKAKSSKEKISPWKLAKTKTTSTALKRQSNRKGLFKQKQPKRRRTGPPPKNQPLMNQWFGKSAHAARSRQCQPTAKFSVPGLRIPKKRDPLPKPPKRGTKIRRLPLKVGQSNSRKAKPTNDRTQRRGAPEDNAARAVLTNMAGNLPSPQPNSSSSPSPQEHISRQNSSRAKSRWGQY